MNPSKSELSYRRSAVEGASPIGLMVVLFDRLITDLRRAATALRSNDIEGRCKQTHHAYLVLGLLESWLDMERGGESAKAIALFYAQIRKAMIDAGCQKSAPILEKQIDFIVKVRSAWQLLDTPSAPGASFQTLAAPSVPMPELQPERSSFSLSA